MNYGTREKQILRMLSDNARSTTTELAKAVSCSRTTAAKLVEALTKELDIRFTLEIDTNKLSVLERHLIVVKLSKKPDVSALENLFAGEKYVHDVYLMKGNFDLVVIATASNPVEYILWETRMIQGLSKYVSSIKPSEIAFLSFGFVPLNDSFVEDISRDVRVDDAERNLLRILNHNSRTSYRELAAMSGISEDMARYKVFNLKKKGIIKRFTIATQRPQKDYALAFLENWVYRKNFDDRAAVARAGMMNADKELPLLDTFQFSAPLTGSFGNFAMGLFSDRKEAMREVVRKHKRIYETDALEIRHARVVKVLKGLLPFRNLNIKENYLVVRWQ